MTKKLRRVARFDPQIVKKAIQANQPTRIVLNHLDYVDATFSFLEKATLRIQSFVSEVERVIAGEVSYFGFGPGSLIKNEKSGIELVYHKARFLTN